MLKKVSDFITNRWVELIMRWCIGVVFIYASYHKILHPADFAKVIYGYKLFPAEMINLTAIVLPYVELFCGVLLCAGVWTRSTALIINFLLLCFIIAISVNLIRGHQFDCGCFSVQEQGDVSSAVMLLIRDVFWFAGGFVVIAYKKKRLYAFTL